MMASQNLQNYNGEIDGLINLLTKDKDQKTDLPKLIHWRKIS